MQWKRRACLIFGIVFGFGLTTLVGHYGYISSDDPKTGIIVAFIYAGLAGGALFGEGFCVQVWLRSRGLAIAGGAVLGIAAIINISNSLDAVVGRGAKTYAAMAAAKETRAGNKDEKDRLEARRESMTFTPASDDAVEAAKDAVASAEAAMKAECGNGDPKLRGRFCRDRESDERTARADLKTVIEQNELTKEAARIDARIGDLTQALSKVEGIQDAEAAQQGGSIAIARLFRLPTTWAGWIADWKMLVLSAVLDLMVMVAFVFYEVLGWPTREERKKPHQPSPPTAPTPSMSIPAKAQAIDRTPEPVAPTEPKPHPQSPVPDRPRPRLAAATKQPVGAVLDFLHDGTDIQAGARTEMADAFLRYSAWCKTHTLRVMGVGEFVDAMDKCCKQFGIRTAVESDAHYLLDVQLLPATAAQKADEVASS